MRKYFTAFIGFSFLAVIITVICLVSFKPIDSLMKPPLSDGENHEIQVAFESSVNETYKLRAPLSGAYRSSYISEDLNSDGQDEIIVLYSTEDAVDIVNIALMIKKNDQWDVVSHLESNYSEVHQVKFADVDGDGLMEIFVGWTVYKNDYSRTLNVYRVPFDKNKSFEKLYGCSYLLFDAVDVDRDRVTDIVVIESTDKGIELSFNNYHSDEIVRQSTIPLDSSVYSVYNLSYDNGADDRSVRMFVDSHKIDSGIITECVYWNSNEQQLSKVESGGVSVLSSRLTGVACQDVNDDGLIDIPIEVALDESKVISEYESKGTQKQNIIKWIQLGKSGYEYVTNQLIYDNNDFRITFSENWMENITVTNNYKNSSITFYSRNGNNLILFELKYTSTQIEEDQLSNKYKLLTETGKGKLFYIIYNQDNSLNINKVYIEKTIILNGG